MAQVKALACNQSQQSDTKPASGGILKFINEQNSACRPQGKKCNPYRQFGISSEAPAQFCTKNSLIADMAKFKQAKNKLSSQPEYYSQKNFFTVGHSIHPKPKQKSEENNFVSQYNLSCSQNKIAFHRSSSKISKFYESNAWMGNRFYVMGHERSEKALEIAKTDAEINARSTRSAAFSRKRLMTPAVTSRTSKLFPTHQSMKELFLTEKARIREMRNMLASQCTLEAQDRRPKTGLQYSRKRSAQKIQISSQKKPRQFEINMPEWGQKDFNVRFIDWNPQKAKETPQLNLTSTLKRTQPTNFTTTTRKFFG